LALPGAPNLFREDLLRNLNRIFTPQRGGFEVPTVLSGVVTLAHEIPGTFPYVNYSIYDAIAAAGVVQLITVLSPPDGFIWIIDELAMRCSDATSRTMTLAIRYVNPVGTTVIPVFRVDTGTSALWFPLGRRLILPPQSLLDLSVPAIGAPETLRFTFMYLQVPAGQFAGKT